MFVPPLPFNSISGYRIIIDGAGTDFRDLNQKKPEHKAPVNKRSTY